MFRHFHPRGLALAWAGANEACPIPVSHIFQHGRHFGGGWGDEQRTRRGDIKFMLLEMLSDRPRHGYDLIKELEIRFGGFRRLSPGSVYPTLQMLEEGGYLTSQQESGKRVYTITDSGRQLLEERTQQTSETSPRDVFSNFMGGKPQEFGELRRAATELADAVMQVARSGNLERMKQVRDRLEQVKRDIYAILAQE